MDYKGKIVIYLVISKISDMVMLQSLYICTCTDYKLFILSHLLVIH